MNPTKGRMERKLGIIKILCRNPGITLEELEKYTGRTKSELTNDLGELFMVGSYPYTPADYIDIDYDGHKINLNLPASIDKTIGLSIQEWLSIRKLVESILQEKKGKEEEAQLLTILEKIQKIIPSGRYLDHENLRGKIQLAINKGLKIKFEYQKRMETGFEERLVDPWFIFDEQTAYLGAYCNTKNGIRNFRLESIQNLEIIEMPIEHFPSSLETRDFVKSFREFVEKTSETSEEAEILVTPNSYFNLSKILDMETIEKEVEWKGRRFRRESAKIIHEAWFLDIIKSFGDSVILISPKKLRERLKTEIQSLIEIVQSRKS
jgi:proteasome accessory factor C